PTPSTPGSHGSAGAHPSRYSPSASYTKRKSPLTASHGQVSGVEPRRDVVGPTIMQRPLPAVYIPPFSQSTQLSEYQNVPDDEITDAANGPDATITQRLTQSITRAEPVAKSIDHREKTEASLRNFRELIGAVFEAEDHLQADTSGAVSATASAFFSDNGGSGGGTATLVPAVLVKLESSMQKVIADARFADVPLDDLLRLQGLGESALKAADASEIRVDESWSEDNVHTWLQQVDLVDVGLKSARMLARMMTGGREEKQLYSEDMLQSILKLLKSALDTCLVPVVEIRPTGAMADTFKSLAAQVKVLASLLNQTNKLMRLIAHVLAKEEVTESVVTTVEFLATSLIFVENAHFDKDSVVGVAKFDRVRVTAMDILIEIFARYPDQRTFVFDEILTSLEKLPVTRQGARHYKLPDGGNIQLVSALIMRLIQSSAIRSEHVKARPTDRSLGEANGEGEPMAMDRDESDEEGDDDEPLINRHRGVHGIESEAAADRDPMRAMEQLGDLSRPLFDAAQKNAHYVIHFLVSRALKSTKTGDDPYRVLLDIFTEDFITVLGSTDWPAAELLLRLLLTSMIGIMEGDKSPAPAKNMALDLMGLMGSAISDVAAYIRHSALARDSSEAGLDARLGLLVDDFLEGKTRDEDLLVWNGPYRATLEYLQQRNVGEDSQIASARGYSITLWAYLVSSAFPLHDEEAGDRSHDARTGRLAFRLKQMLADPTWLEKEFEFDDVSTAQGRLAYSLSVMQLPFSKAFERILLILLNSMNNDQATVRSKSMKGVIQLLEKDPTILDRGAYVMRSIVTRTCDPSPLVRDSAVGLVGKCLTLKPALEDQVWESVLARVTDAQVGVRKRSMKILKSIYLRNTKRDVKSAIADALLHRARDTDEGVSELARLTLEEIWLAPFHRPAGEPDASVQSTLALTDQVLLIVKTVQRGDSVASVLEWLLRNMMSNATKSSAANFRVCKSMVALMFEKILDEGQLDALGRPQILRTLTVFARANPRLFTSEQLELLQPYLEHLSTTDDLQVYRSVVIIFRWVLPRLSTLKSHLLFAVQGALLGSLSKLGKRELNEVVPCLWTINGVLKNIERLSRATVSCLKGAYAAKDANLGAADSGGSNVSLRVIKYITIAGLFGKYCDFSADVARFRAELPWWKGDSVPRLMIDVLAPFTRPSQPLRVRSAALEGLCAICYAWPDSFLQEQVYTAFDIVFAESRRELEDIVLLGFKDFLGQEERRSEKVADPGAGDSEEDEFGTGRLGGALIGNQHDGVGSSIAQRYLPHIIRIAKATQDAHALIAVEVIASISRQGLLHPKECGPVLIALETSTHPTIASLAFQEHRALHQKHETVLDKEYLKAVQQAFLYQRQTVGDAHGATLHPPTAKLRSLFDVMKISKGKMRKKFLSSLCTRADFDPVKLNANADVPPHLEYARFLMENIAFFEYHTVDEILHVIGCLERLVTGTGTGVAHAIEVELVPSSATVPAMDDLIPPAPELEAPVIPAPSPARLRQLTVATMILSIAWDTRSYLRRAYGYMGAKYREATAKGSAKDLNKAPIKFTGVSNERVWDEISKTMASLADTTTMMAQCRKFVDLLSVDHELKVAAEDEEEVALHPRPETPSEDEAAGSPGPPNGSGRGKRKASSETPVRSKKRRQPSGSKAKKGSDDSDDEDWG
ncbi:MAG: Sister chromatid cohesion protein 2, partial [Thelocarpon superellum]